MIRVDVRVLPRPDQMSDRFNYSAANRFVILSKKRQICRRRIALPYYISSTPPPLLLGGGGGALSRRVRAFYFQHLLFPFKKTLPIIFSNIPQHLQTEPNQTETN